MDAGVAVATIGWLFNIQQTLNRHQQTLCVLKISSSFCLKKLLLTFLFFFKSGPKKILEMFCKYYEGIQTFKTKR